MQNSFFFLILETSPVLKALVKTSKHPHFHMASENYTETGELCERVKNWSSKWHKDNFHIFFFPLALLSWQPPDSLVTITQKVNTERNMISLTLCTGLVWGDND